VVVAAIAVHVAQPGDGMTVVVLRDVNYDPSALRSLLLLSGYLTARKVDLVDGTLMADLAFPPPC